MFTKTAGFRHPSIPVARQAVRELGAQSGFAVDATEDANAFSDGNLARYEAVVFLMTTGDVLDSRQQVAFQRFIRTGGGFAGVHSAADTEYDWAWYGGLLGAYFRNHPQIQQAVIRVENARDPSTVGLPRRWARNDEWYNFARNPRRAARVLATLDESTYSPGAGAMGRTIRSRGRTATRAAGRGTPAAAIPTSRTPSHCSEGISSEEFVTPRG